MFNHTVTDEAGLVTSSFENITEARRMAQRSANYSKAARYVGAERFTPGTPVPINYLPGAFLPGE